jgi:hypothetical protein
LIDKRKKLPVLDFSLLISAGESPFKALRGSVRLVAVKEVETGEVVFKILQLMFPFKTVSLFLLVCSFESSVNIEDEDDDEDVE